MTRVKASFYVLREDDATLTLEADPDDIGEAEVLDALRELYPFDEIDRDSLYWEVDRDADD